MRITCGLAAAFLSPDGDLIGDRPIISGMRIATAEELAKWKEVIKLLSDKKSKIAIMLSDHIEAEVKSLMDVAGPRNQELIMEITRMGEEIKEDMIFPISKPKYDKKAAQERERAKAISSKHSAKNCIRHVGRSWAMKKSRKKFN